MPTTLAHATNGFLASSLTETLRSGTPFTKSLARMISNCFGRHKV